MKRKGRYTLEVIMWVWVCYNREVLLLCTPPYILLMTTHHTYHQSYFWHHKTCSYYSTMIKSSFTIQNLELVSGPQTMRLYCLFGMESQMVSMIILLHGNSLNQKDIKYTFNTSNEGSVILVGADSTVLLSKNG